MMKETEGKMGSFHRSDKSIFQVLYFKILFAIFVILSGLSVSSSEVYGNDTILIASGATWKYLDNGSDQGTAWRIASYDDSTWLSGPAELGYGDGDESTVVGFGPDPNNKYVTTYFRHSFTVVDASIYSLLTLRLLRDDGAIVYLNGSEVFRTNMPMRTITYATPASSPVGGADEEIFHSYCINPEFLKDGMNILAVEIHQSSGTSSDISFALELIGHTAPPVPSVLRGPYLQMGTPTSISIKWRTDKCSDSRVSYGNDLANLNMASDDTVFTTEHEIPLTGLQPSAKYFYSIGTTTGVLAGGDNDHFFLTSPLSGTGKPTRIWIIGDSGTADANAQAVRDAYLSFTGTRSTDVWLMLGDNAYYTGTDFEYQAALFDMYPMLLRNTVLWPTLGNHDSEPNGVSSSLGTGPYFDIFTLPTHAEAGGLNSGTEAYYSFDYGNIHFVNLNSTASDRTPAGMMLTWLKNDLAATNKDWIIAYWHHAPYSKGSHDSDFECPLGIDCRMKEMRENVLPILENYGVDLVLTGHSHSYERSFLINGHYGTSDTLTQDMIIDSGDGCLNIGGAYSKNGKGTVYVVAGSSGLISGGTLNHPAMASSFNELGSLVLDVNDNQLDASFIDSGGAILDCFTIVKGPDCNIVMSKDNYTVGDTVTASTFTIANLGKDQIAVELKVWLKILSYPPLAFINIGTDGSFILPPGFDMDLGPVSLFPVDPGIPSGDYEFNCRMLDPVTGELSAEDLNRFTITP